MSSFVASGAPATVVTALGRRRRHAWRGGRSGRTVGARLVGPGCVVLSSVSLQSAAALATTVFAAFGSAGTAGLRFAAGAAVLLALARPRMTGRPARTWLAIALFGATTAGAGLCLFAALGRIPLGTAVASCS
jgi:inner membrane transporter RhtA